MGKAPEVLLRERFETVPYRCTLRQACPVLDTGKDEVGVAINKERLPATPQMLACR